MTSKTDKPRYVDPAGDARNGSLPVRPPFRFSGVTSRVFPLKANMARLTSFCDQYVNMDIDPAIVHYRPALPYVYLMVLDYGSMSSASMHAQNVGWVAQHEVAFTVPLEIWRKEKGHLVFKDWACVSPFIFVDDEMSLTTGREVYGWPKVAGHVDSTMPMWDRHPAAGSRLFTFSTHVFPQVYAGKAEAREVLLQIDTDPPATYSEFPPEPGNEWAPWSVLSQAMRSSLSLAGNALDMALALRVRGYRTNRNVATLKAMGGKAADYALQMGPAFLGPLLGRAQKKADDLQSRPTLAFDNITVKQFRDAGEPDRACYQALVRSRMGIERINRSGLLGDTNLLRGDTSGGYAIRVHRYASQPIIESLGIEVTATETPTEGAPVSLLKPTFPFWTDVDLYYGAGEVVCSRTHVAIDGAGDHDEWVDEQHGARPQAVAPLTQTSGYASEVAAPGQAPPAPGACFDFYNTALGAATQPMAGPFHFPDVTLQVYPLLADRECLDRFVQQYLNDPLRCADMPQLEDDPLHTAGMRFETMGSYAYLLVQVTGDQLGTMWSGANNIGWWAERELQFCVPVKWFKTNEQGREELVSMAMVAPFVYSSNGRAVITDREVNGRPSVQADIESPKDVWLESSGPDKPRRYLELATEVFPALGYGQKAEKRTLLQIDGDDVLAYNDSVGWRMVAERWGRDLVVDLMRKALVQREQPQAVQDARALALEVLGHGAPVNWLVLKQYRDGEDVDKACYQALVHTTRSVSRIFDMREIENRVHVRVHRYPGHPIVETLGLKIKSLDSGNGEVVQNLQPLRPFWMRVSVQEELAQVVAVRKTDGGWNVMHPWFQSPGQAADARTPTQPYFSEPGPTRVSAQWPISPQRLHDQAAQALRAALASSLEGAVTAARALKEDARRAVAAGLGGDAAGLWGRVLGADSAAECAKAHTLEELLALEQGLRDAGLQWTAADPQRLDREQARASIASLDEVQVVLDLILSQEWENWGNPRWYQNLPAKPDHCAPNDSVTTPADPRTDLRGLATLDPALSDAVSAQAQTLPGFRADAGLATTADGAWCYVRFDAAPPTLSSSRSTGTRRARRAASR